MASSLHRCGWTCLLLAAVGCGSNSGFTIVPVTGKVLLDGKPLTSGSVMTQPAKGPGSQGQIDAEGRFTLSTRGHGPGAIVGNHQVAVVAIANPEAYAKNPESTVTLVTPARYAQMANSQLTINVQAEAPNDVTLELSTKAH